jgi:adenine-specific DNA-methyltransferase
MPGIADYIVWYAKARESAKFRPLFTKKRIGRGTNYTFVEEPDGTRRRMTKAELDEPESLASDLRVFQCEKLASSGFTASCFFDIELDGRIFKPKRTSWRTNREGIESLKRGRRLHVVGDNIYYVSFAADNPLQSIPNVWTDTRGEMDPAYVVQTSRKVIARCMLLSTDPGDLVLDPTCGSGTTASVAEQWGRRWITCDTSRVAVTLTKQRLVTDSYPSYELAAPAQGAGGGFVYRTVPHVTLSSLANGEPAPNQALYDKPVVEREKMRVTGPFTVEAVPAPVVAEMDPRAAQPMLDASIARGGATQRHSDWRAELLETGARGFGGAAIRFSRVELLAGTRSLHAEAETVEEPPRRVVISFGPDYAPLEQQQVRAAWEEARGLRPRPDIVLFAAFGFDPEAAAAIDEMPAAARKETTFLKAQMNPDLLTDDLKKKRAGNQSFWLVGRPDVEVVAVPGAGGMYQVAVHGFDYYDLKTSRMESGDSARIAMWMLDPDYDGRCLIPRQVFFPSATEKAGWNRLAKTLRAELDAELLRAYRGTTSLPFAAGRHRRIAAKIIDNRGIESLRVLDLP